MQIQNHKTKQVAKMWQRKPISANKNK